MIEAQPNPHISWVSSDTFKRSSYLVEDEEDRHYLKNNMDATRLFDEYKNKARDMSTRDLLKLETNIHELLALTTILLLSPKQSSA